MALPTELTPDTSYRLLYSGQVGVQGINVQQAWDLRQMPMAARSDPNFRDLFRIFVRQVDPGISAVSKVVSFLPATGVPEEVVLTLTAAAFWNLIDIEFWFLHSVIR
jgi:hypothetical protein